MLSHSRGGSALGDDLVTLQEHSANSEGGMIILSRQFDRQPHGEIPVTELFRRAIRVSETFRLPFPEAVYCSNCGTYQRASAFPKNRTKGQGMDVWCKSCHADYSRKWREEKAAIEGREIRPYRRRWDDAKAA